jgi:hypothetical protein
MARITIPRAALILGISMAAASGGVVIVEFVDGPASYQAKRSEGVLPTFEPTSAHAEAINAIYGDV